ncbi:MAG: hypothetical protein KDA52_24785 [Planctomycetaceae bacterium]|nr:hypothetical protein [Planctomycetaceae bacterium]
MSNPEKRPDSSEAEALPSDGDAFVYFHEELDQFLRAVRDYVVKGLVDHPSPVDASLYRLIAKYAEDFARAVRRSGRDDEAWQEVIAHIEPPASLGDVLVETQTESGHARFREYLDQLPFPHYEANPDDSSSVVRISADGTRTVGRFVDREFRSSK